MADATLTLSEHELYFLPPGTPATAPALRVEIDFRGQKHWIIVRLEYNERWNKYAQYRALWQPEGAEDSRVFASQITVQNGPDKVDEALSRIGQSIDMGSVRLWCAPDASFGVEVSTENYGRIEWRKDGARTGTETFSWELKWTNREFANLPQLQFVAMLEAAHDNENSSLQRVVRWHALTRDEKDSIAFGCQHGDWNELRRLFACVQVVIYHECGPFPYLRQVHWTKPAPDGDGKPVLQAREVNWQWFFDEPLYATAENSVEKKWRMRWRNALCQIARPNFWPDEPIYAFNWRRSHRDFFQYRVECGMPTADEALEAQLELRDFLRPHVSADEIEKLLQP